MLTWEDNSDYIRKQIKCKFKHLKILLKTKNEFYFIKKWVDHHYSDGIGLIIFDNNSDDLNVLNYYLTLPDDVLVVKYFGYHNDIHNLDLYSDLYTSIQESSTNFIALDTDEFLAYTDGKFVYPPDSLFNFSFDIFRYGVDPCLWMYNDHYSEKLFEFGSIELIKERLNWGKPIIHRDVLLKGYINHNVQILDNITNALGIRFFVFHLVNLNPLQRVNANLRKLISRGILPCNANIEDVIDLRRNDYHGEDNVILYINEIIHLIKMPSVIENSSSPVLTKSGFIKIESISKVSKINYYSVDEELFFSRVLAGDIAV